jgi:hypothetical protein
LDIKKPFRNHETAAGQRAEKTEPKAAEPTATKTFWPFRGLLFSKVPRFVNWCMG